MMVASSSRPKGPFLTSGLSWLSHLCSKHDAQHWFRECCVTTGRSQLLPCHRCSHDLQQEHKQNHHKTPREARGSRPLRQEHSSTQMRGLDQKLDGRRRLPGWLGHEAREGC
jgi:hypothetical protein